MRIDIQKVRTGEDVGIIGGGFVGQILKRLYQKAAVYDKNIKLDSILEVMERPVIFLAINLKDNAISDESKQELQLLFRQMLKNTIVIIKSTFIPGTTDWLQEEFPHLRLCYNPEFLTEMTAWNDFLKPQFQILGLPHQSLELYNDLFNILPDAPIKSVISPKDAETLKHAFNSYYALKVTWFNQLYDACQQLGADYETIRSLMVQNPYVGNSHSVYMHKGYVGWGGKCLTKDVPSLAKIVKFPLLNKVIELNEQYSKNL